MGRNTVNYAGEQDTEGFSIELWKNCPVDYLKENRNAGIIIEERFTSFGGATTAYYGESGMFLGYIDTGCTIAQDSTARGACKITLPSSGDEREAMIQSGNGTGCPFSIAAAGRPLWYEAIVKKSLVDNTIGVLFGLGGASFPGDGAIADAGNDLADKAFVGFFVWDTDGDNLKFVSNAASQALTTHKDDIAGALTADTWVKAGFYFDGKRIIPYINGAKVESGIITASALAAATFPSGVALAPLFGAKIEGTVGGSSHMRCFRVAQLAA